MQLSDEFIIRLSMMKWFNLVWLAITSIEVANAATVSYDFTVSWVRANPDGRLARPVIGINGAWPPPHIEANVGDNIVVTLRNELGNQSTSLHFHGIWQNGTTHYDGPVGVSQCGIIPGATFVYNFTVGLTLASDCSENLVRSGGQLGFLSTELASSYC